MSAIQQLIDYESDGNYLLADAAAQELAALRSEIANYETARQEDARRLEQVTAEREAMREALKPFADAAESIDMRPISKDWRDSKTITTGVMVFDVITVGDLRKAAAALKGGKG